MLNVHLYTRQHTEIQYSLKYTSLTPALLDLCVNIQRSILQPIVLVSLYFLLLSLFEHLPFTNDDNGRYIEVPMPGNVQLVVGTVNYMTNLDPLRRLSGIDRQFGITSQL